LPKTFDGIRKKKSRNRPSPPSFTFKKINLQIIVVVVILGLLAIGSFFIIRTIKDKLEIITLFRSGKYLIIFQNNAEIRPTGGFIGSFAVATFSEYRLKDFNFDTNIYKLDKSYSFDHNIPSPGPLQTITDKWALRDSNWAISFPESAQQIEWFYKQETGQDVDGVIAINGSVLRDVLKITGPIGLSNYNTIINYDNFFNELTTQIEDTYFNSQENQQENEPKTILKDLMPEVFQRIKTHKLQVLKLAYKEILQKQILFYSRNSNIENDILARNWGGEIQKTSSDYLSVNQASIVDVVRIPKVGGKSSVSVKEKIDYKVEKQEAVLIGNLTVTRMHEGTYYWPDGINHNWTRVLVPKGSVLQTATMDGADYKDVVVTDIESQKTTFGFWTQTAPQTSTVVNLTYILPVSLQNYSLLVQKQSGNLGDQLTVTFGNKLLFSGVLDEDKTIKQ